MSDEIQFTERHPSPPVARAGFGLAAAALVLPVVAAIVLFFVKSFWPALAISAATVIVTSILLAIDARRLARSDPNKQRGESPGLLLLGMLALWIVFYPFAFFRRKRFGGPNLAIPSILVALFFFLGPLAQSLFVPAGLPECSSPEVAQALAQAIKQVPLGSPVKSIDGHHELEYDRKVDRRKGECVVHTETDDLIVLYTVAWRDRAKGEFEVRTFPILPACTSPDVAKVLESIIRRTAPGPRLKSIDSYRQISYDRASDRRDGTCVVHTEGADIPVKFQVRWRDPDKGEFLVELTK